MSIYDLRSLFPLGEREFPVGTQSWICRLVEVSDKRPDEDRLTWYLVFELGQGKTGREENLFRNLEIVTTADHLIANGFGADLNSRIENWIGGDEQDGRVEWLDY